MNEFKEFNSQVVQRLEFSYSDCSRGGFELDPFKEVNRVVVKQLQHQNVFNQIVTHTTIVDSPTEYDLTKSQIKNNLESACPTLAYTISKVTNGDGSTLGRSEIDSTF